MAQEKQSDLYAVAAGTHEVRVYSIRPQVKTGSFQLDKLLTLTAHRQPATDVCFTQNFAVTISAGDGLLILHSFNLDYNQSTIVCQK